MVNDLKDSPSKNAFLSSKTSSKFPMSTITENALDQSSINSDYPSDNLQISPSRHLIHKTQTGLYFQHRFILNVLHANYPKCQNLNSFQNANPIIRSLLTTQKPVTSSMSHPSLPHYSRVTPKSDTSPSNSTTLDSHETETPVQIYSKTNFFSPPSF